MTTFFHALGGLCIRPLGLTVLVLATGTALVGWLRFRKLGRILQDLASRPAAERLYTLEREYRLHPRREARPMAYVRRLRRQWRALVVGVLCLVVAGFTGMAARETLAARTVRLRVRNLAITPEGTGYVWQLELRNRGRRIVLVDAMRLRVLRVKKRLGKSLPLPAETGSQEIPVVWLEPGTRAVALLKPGEHTAVAPGDTRVVMFAVQPHHRPQEGWSYWVRFELRWHGAGNVISHWDIGPTYRLSWPGLLHWSESGPPEQRATRPVADSATMASP